MATTTTHIDAPPEEVFAILSQGIDGAVVRHVEPPQLVVVERALRPLGVAVFEYRLSHSGLGTALVLEQRMRRRFGRARLLLRLEEAAARALCAVPGVPAIARLAGVARNRLLLRRVKARVEQRSHPLWRAARHVVDSWGELISRRWPNSRVGKTMRRGPSPRAPS